MTLRTKNIQMIGQNLNKTVYRGYLIYSCIEYCVELCNISTESTYPLENANLCVPHELKMKWKDCIDMIQLRMKHSRSVSEFIAELQNVIDKLQTGKIEESSMRDGEYYERMMRELEHIGWDSIVDINDTLDVIQFVVQDEKQRRHELSLWISERYPMECPVLSNYYLPSEFKVDWKDGYELKDIIAQFKIALSGYQLFWDAMDELDQDTWILEPEIPYRDCKTRRIAIGKHCSVFVELNAKDPSRLQEIRFMGSDSQVQPLRASMAQRMDRWNVQDSLAQNLEYVLQIQFPKPQTSNKDEFTMDCGICYCYRLKEVAPDRVCENQKCSKPYHNECLLEWLRSLPMSNQSFNTIFGTCSYCQEHIHAVLP